MCGHYLRKIREVQPHGPYTLAGWSMGGLIAMEAARQLTAAGEHVALVALVDTYLAVPDDANLDPDEISGIRWIASHLKLPLQELKDLPLPTMWERIERRAAAVEGEGVADIRLLAAACKTHLAAIARYRITPYHGRRRVVPCRRRTRRVGRQLDVDVSPDATGSRAGKSLFPCFAIHT